MYPHMPEWVMRQFGFIQGIPRDTLVSTPLVMVPKDVDAMYNDLYNHLVLEETLSVLASQ